ncbi:succinyl-diaminopimelate desuccinylase [Janibacter corallicola]|uniref:succinyl-diaminopimelate desuccinylase n=1 Tax=Janibacter corallicola TaxID=415212 RepID=UPI000829DA4A|nr:succinyl-diaminopimelate desuccinylase [Janibacter corallicola]
MPTLDLSADVVSLTQQLCDIESVSRDEGAIADAVEAALTPLEHLRLTRRGNTIVARTDLGREERVVLAGHLDTVPLTDPPNLPVRRERVGGAEVLYGRGTVDMKGGVAVALKAALLPAPSRDLTFLFYEAEEIDEKYNGLALLAESDPGLLEADFAVLMEPTAAAIEGGCKGTMRVEVELTGIAAHSARPWNGHNAIHDAHEVLAALAEHTEQTVTVDGLDYHEALQAVGINGGIAGNVIPDRCTVLINYRFAPDKDADEALAYVQSVLPGRRLRITDLAEGARPGLDRPAARSFLEALDVPVGPKEGWTDVARFATLGIPAVNFGPGDPNLAHHDEERCPVEQIETAETAVLRWLT